MEKENAVMVTPVNEMSDLSDMNSIAENFTLMAQQVQTLVETNNELIEQVKEIKLENKNLMEEVKQIQKEAENNILLTPAQAKSLQKLAQQHVEKLCRDFNLSHSIYFRTGIGHLWTDAKAEFGGVKTYRAIRGIDYQPAKEYVTKWEPIDGMENLKMEVDDKSKGGDLS